MPRRRRRRQLQAVVTILLLWRKRKQQRRRQRSVWVRQIFSQRRQQGEFHSLLQEMRFCDPENHFRYLRMSKERFDSLLTEVRYKTWIENKWRSYNIGHLSPFLLCKLFILQQVAPFLTHRRYHSDIRASISPAERLALTIRFLATGNSQVFRLL